MAVLAISEWLGTPANYDAAAEEIGRQSFPAEEDSDFHAMAVTADGHFMVYEGWKDRATCEAFMAKVMPLITAQGIQRVGEISFLELHSMFIGQDQAAPRMQDA